MSDSVVDTRVVELKFNNAQFEKNVKSTLSTLEKLKKALNFDTVTTSINLLQNALQLRGLKNVQGQLEQIIGAIDRTVSPLTATINMIGETITRSIGGAINGVISQIKTGGMSRAMNIEAAKFSLQGIGIKWEDIGDSITNAVSGTAYGLDAAAKAASTLSASGITLDMKTDKNGKQLTEMEQTLKGISGVAAQTNKDFESVAAIFSTVAGNGRLMGMQLSQLSTYGLNAAADIGKAMGKTESEIRDMTSKGEISAKEFFEVMYNLYWENAAKANDTISGVTANIKASLSRIGAAFVSPIMANQGPAVKFLKTVKDQVDTIASRLKPIGSKDDKGNDISGKLVKYVVNNVIKYMEALRKYIAKFDVIKLWRSIYRVLKGGFKIIMSFANYLQTIFKALNKAVKATIGPFLDALIKLTTGWFRFTNVILKSSRDMNVQLEVLRLFRRVFKGIIRWIKPVVISFGNLVEAVKGFVKELDIRPIGDYGKLFYRLTRLMRPAIVETEYFTDILNSLWSVVKHVWGIIKAFGQAVYETFQEANFKPLEYFQKVLHTLTDGIVSNDKKTEKLKNTFKIFTTAIALVAKAVGFIILIFAKAINGIIKFGGALIEVLSPVGQFVSKVFDAAAKAQEFGQKLGEQVVKKFKEFIKAIKEFDISKFTNLSKVVDGLKDIFGGLVDFVKKVFGGLWDGIQAVFTFLYNVIKSINFDPILNAFYGIIDGILAIVLPIGAVIAGVFKGAADIIVDAFKGVLEFFQNVFGKATGKDIDDTNDKLSKTGGFLENIKNINIAGTIADKLRAIGDAIGGFIDKVKNTKIFKAISSGLSNFFSQFKANMKSFTSMEGDVSVFDAIARLLKGNIKLFITAFEEIGRGLNSVWKEISPIIESSAFGKVMQFISNIFLTLTALNWSQAAKNFSKGLSEFTSVLNVEFQSTKKQTRWFKDFAVSVLVFAGAIYVLGNMDQGKLKQGLIAVGILSVILAGIAIYFNKINKSEETLYGELEGNKADGLTGIIGKKTSSIENIAKALVKMSVSIVILAIAMKIIATMKPGEVFQGMAVVGLLMLGMTAMIKTLNKNGTVSGDDVAVFDQSGAAIKKLGVSILIMALAFKLISTIKTDDCVKAGAVFALFGVIMWVIMQSVQRIIKAVGNSEYSAGALESMASIIKKLGTTMLLMAITFKILSKIKTDDAIKAGVIMGGMMLGIIAIFAALSYIAKQAKGSKNYVETLNLAADGIDKIGKSILILSIAMKVLSTIPLTSVGPAILVLAGAMAVLIGTVFILEKLKLTLALELFATAMLTLGMAALSIAGSIFLIAAGLSLLCGIGPALLVVLPAIGMALADAFNNFIEKINVKNITDFLLSLLLDIISGIVKSITDHFAEWAITIVDGIHKVISVIVENLDEDLPKIATIITKLLDMIVSNIANWMPKIVFILKTVISGLTDMVPELVELIKNLILNILTALQEIAPELAQTFIVLLTTLLSSVVQEIDIILNKVWEMLVLVGNFLMEKVPAIVDWLARFVGTVLASLVMALPTTIATFVNTIIDKFKELLGINSPSTVFKEIGTFLIEGLIQGLWDAIDGVLDFFDDLVEDILDALVNLPGDLLDIGKNLITNLKDGITAAAKGIKTFFTETVPDKIKDALDIVEWFLDKGKSFITNLKDGIENVAKGIKDWICKTVVDLILEAFDLYEKMKEVGKNIIKGLKDGVEDLAGDAVDAVGDVAKGIINAPKKLLKIFSPSREFRWIGNMIDQGLINGINDQSDNAVQAVSNMATDVLKPMANVTDRISEMIDDSMGSPTITPVIDMTNLNAASASINSMFSNRSMGVDANINGIASSFERIQNEDPNSNILSAINGLKDNINNNINTYNVNGITYDDGSNIADAVGQLINATMINRRM